MGNFSNPFYMILQQERVKHLSSGVSMGGDSMSTLVKIRFIVKLYNTSYHYLCISGALNVPNEIFNTCFNPTQEV